MKIQAVYAVYFSATGTTERVVTAIAQRIAQSAGCPYTQLNFTPPAQREQAARFGRGDLIIFGTPVYAGRVPNVLLKYLKTLQGDGALAVPVVLFGNRDFDDALVELRDILVDGGLHPFAAAAFVGEHSFSKVLAAGRPDAEDMRIVEDFAQRVFARLSAANSPEDLPLVAVQGTPRPYRGYYQPRDRAGNPVDIRKVKPKVNEDCNDCKLCVSLCPMGSIDAADVSAYNGICIKCGACIKGCPQHARYYDDAGYLYHQRELEEGLTRRALPSLFV